MLRHAAAVGTSGQVVRERSPWSPLRISAFRALWLAQLGSMIGTWMQTVGAQWLLVDEPNASTLVSLVQTAGLLPMLLLALPAGVLADAFDRRRLLVGVQLATFVVGVILAVLTLTRDMPPALLLTFTFLLGAGAAVSMPPWQALIPDIVPRDDIRGAAALGAVSVNLARAVGPALAGISAPPGAGCEAWAAGRDLIGDNLSTLVVRRPEAAGCRADLDGDGELTFFDFLAFQDLFAAGDLRADFTRDGVLDFFDFLEFQDEFAAGCA